MNLYQSSAVFENITWFCAFQNLSVKISELAFVAVMHAQSLPQAVTTFHRWRGALDLGQSLSDSVYSFWLSLATYCHKLILASPVHTIFMQNSVAYAAWWTPWQSVAWLSWYCRQLVVASCSISVYDVFCRQVEGGVFLICQIFFRVFFSFMIIFH